MRTIIVFIVFALALTVVPFVSGDDHDNSWRGVDLDRWFGVQFEVCKLRPGKTMSDVLKLDNEARKQFAANTQGISLLRLTPMFSHAMPGDSAADYLNIVMGSIPDIGASWGSPFIVTHSAGLLTVYRCPSRLLEASGNAGVSTPQCLPLSLSVAYRGTNAT